jgi:hypothetical protein
MSENRAPHGFVGTIGSRHGLLKVALPDKRRRVRVACPHGCAEGSHETADAMVRPRRPGEVCDAVLAPPTAAAEPPARHGNVKVSDDAILAAIPFEDTAAKAIAEAAGFVGNTASVALVARVEWINADAESKREPAPVAIARQGAPRPTLLRRREGRA